MTLNELDVVRDWLLLLGRKTAQEKVATFLTILARRAAVSGSKPPTDGLTFELPLTREAMGDCLGLSIESVSRQMTGLRRCGVIDLLDGRLIHVPNYLALLDVAGEDADGGPIA